MPFLIDTLAKSQRISSNGDAFRRSNDVSKAKNTYSGKAAGLSAATGGGNQYDRIAMNNQKAK